MSPIPPVPEIETTLRVGQELVGRYRLVRLIDRGGMAEVWEGRDEVLARPVAIKALHAHLVRDASFQARFRREAVAAARLAHPNIVATFDTGVDGDVTFIVMELVRGRSLRAVLADRGPLPPGEAAFIAGQVARALEHSHRSGLIHRDVKPANILICDEPGRRGQVKVTDFGIVKAAIEDGTEITATGDVIGTARYLAPEQAQGEEPDARSDVYSLGVVLYEMLAGEPPFSGPTDLATALLHVDAEPPRLRRRRAGIPRSLEGVVLRALAKRPEERYSTAGELGDALASIELGDDADPEIVRDPTPVGGVAVTARRPRRSVVPLIVLVVAATAGVALAAVLGRAGGGGQPGEAGPGGAVAIASATSFDPYGPDGEENEERVGLAIDGDPATAWHTDRYRARTFAIKPGVGLVLRLDGRARLRTLRVESPVIGWAARVYVGSRLETTRLEDWGEAVASASGVAGSATFDLRGEEGVAILIWFTDAGDTRRAEVAEIAVTS